jgi:hypothetical protein
VHRFNLILTFEEGFAPPQKGYRFNNNKNNIFPTEVRKPMKITRKILAAFLAILFAVGTLTFSAFAEGVPAGNENMHVVISTQQQADLGTVLTVTLNITNNYYATNMRWPIIFTKSVFELIGVNGQPTGTDDIVPVTASGQLAAIGSSISAIDATGKSALTGYSNATKYGALLIQWVGNFNNNVVNCYKAPSGSNCISFQLRVKQGITATKGTIQIPSTLTDIFYYQAMNNPSDPSTIYTMNSQTCSMSFTNCDVNINTNVPDIGAVPGSTTIIERFSEADAAYYGFNGYIYNMGNSQYPSYNLANYPILDEAEIREYIQPIGGASLVFTLMDGQYAYTTGTKVEVVYNGATIAKYYIVVFGDVNCDGVCDGSDVSMIDSATQFLPEFTFSLDVRNNAQFYACDLSGDNSCDGGDFTFADSIACGVYLISQDHNAQIQY